MSDIRFVVRKYLHEGLVCLPVKPGEKATRLKNWNKPETKPTEQDFEANYNIAQRLDSVVDIDCDSHEARFIAERLLPFTGRRHGRPSLAPFDSHYWYTVTGDVKFEKFADIDGETSLIEFRTDCGHYTVIPPSVVLIDKHHPEAGSETLQWVGPSPDGAGEIPQSAHVDGPGLFHIVRLIACATILARHWPRSNRHATTLAFAGLMFKLGAHVMEVETMLRAVTALREPQDGRDGWSEIPGTVRSTHDAFKADTPHVGSKELAKLIPDGEAVIKMIFSWFGKKNSKGEIRQIAGYPLTESGDAELFAADNSEIVRFDFRQERWLVSEESSGIWVPDPTEHLTRMVVAVMRKRQRDALVMEDRTDKKKVFTWAMSGESRSRITNTLALARSVPPIADTGDTWDVDPFLLGVQNGVIDLRTGEHRKATPEDRVTMRVRVAFDPAATCPLWERTLSQIFPDPPAVQPPASADLLTDHHPPTASPAEPGHMVAFLKRALGYSITGDCREECCFFAWGEGSNGKGTIMNTLGWLLADYYDDLPMSTLERAGNNGKIPNDLAKMSGRRFITCSEVNEFALNEARLKALTGRDPITARFLHKEFFTFIPVGKIWIATNNKPKVIGQDDGIWRRIHLIPFTQQFLGRENKALKDQLRSELPGILNWILEGTRIWLRDGLQPPDEVRAATAAYRQESNPITPFVEACCVVGSSMMLQAAHGYSAYREYCAEIDAEPWKRLTEKAWNKAMRMVFKTEEKRQVFFLGVGLREERREESAKREPEGLGY
jgi:P4 family phage/plasmid primase-like protien